MKSIYASMISVALMGICSAAPDIDISGMVTDSAGKAIAAANVRLERLGLTATTDQNGLFILKTVTNGITAAIPALPGVEIKAGALSVSLPEKSRITLTTYGIQGRILATLTKNLEAGSTLLTVPNSGTGLRLFKVQSVRDEMWIRAFSLEGRLRSVEFTSPSLSPTEALAKVPPSAVPYVDEITVTKTGYLKSYLGISNSALTGLKIKMMKEGSTKFSFFVTSLKALQALSGSPDGFGGDLRFGETGLGSGLRGADKICAAVAERSLPGSGNKGWRAFLSVKSDSYGNQVNAKDRVGEGPWYDRVGRLVAPTKPDLLEWRPRGGDATIRIDLPNEDGIPNNQPDPTKPPDDNHHTITGTTPQGTLDEDNATCKDWTTSDGSGENGLPTLGYSWPRKGWGGQVYGVHWYSYGKAQGCGAGVDIIENGSGIPGATIIGGGGGYGGFYCFALNP